MKNSVKIALGIVTGGVLVYLNHRRKQAKNREETYTAPDGNTYRKNQTYRTSEGEFYKNGKKMRVEFPGDSHQNHGYVNSHFNNQHLSEHSNVPPQEVSYHQKGVRHK